jgi:hypothetical protein
MKTMKKKLTLTTILIAGFIIFNVKSYSQEIQLSKEDSIANVLQGVKSDVDILKKLKITGYVQFQWQMADTIGGAAGFSGGNFPTASDNRFKLRRGRIKFLYGNDFNQFVMQFDVSEGGFATKDMYAKLTDPFVQSFSLTGGVFNRPFGYEIAYSSSNRESPERARFTQTLFPQERDMGAQFTFNPPKTSRFNFIHLDLGLFTGNGINAEFDTKKDFIGHVWISKTTRSEKIKYGLGVSYYNGGIYQGTKYVYKMGDVTTAVKGFVVDSTTTNKTGFATRQYIGFDGQFSIESPIGISVLRGEYVFGTQPGSSSTTTSPTAAIPNYDTYIRKFNAFYVYFVQSILQTKHQIVVKYDVYDPNTEIAGTDINSTVSGKKTKLGTPDIKYSTIGLGYIYHFDNNIKLSVYYDLVSNENTSIKGYSKLNNYTKDIADNVLTIRLQYKF